MFEVKAIRWNNSRLLSMIPKLTKRNFKDLKKKRIRAIRAIWHSLRALLNYQESNWPFSRIDIDWSEHCYLSSAFRKLVTISPRVRPFGVCLAFGNLIGHTSKKTTPNYNSWAGLVWVRATIGWTCKRNIFSVGPNSACGLLYKNGACAAGEDELAPPRTQFSSSILWLWI